jgi:hypothetical protein
MVRVRLELNVDLRFIIGIVIILIEPNLIL